MGTEELYHEVDEGSNRLWVTAFIQAIDNNQVGFDVFEGRGRLGKRCFKGLENEALELALERCSGFNDYWFPGHRLPDPWLGLWDGLCNLASDCDSELADSTAISRLAEEDEATGESVHVREVLGECLGDRAFATSYKAV